MNLRRRMLGHRGISAVRSADGSGAQFLDALRPTGAISPESGRMSADRVD